MQIKHQATDPGSLSHNVVSSLFEDSQGTLWVGTYGGGLNRYQTQQNRFTHFNHDLADLNSLSDDVIMSIYEDKQGAIWVGTQAGGLNKLDTQRQAFGHVKRHATSPDSLSNNNVWSLYKDSKGILWVGTDGGLNRYNAETQDFSHFKHQPAKQHSLSSNFINSIVEDREGTLWIGSYGGGLNKYNRDTQRFEHFKHDSSDLNSLSDNLVITLLKDSKNTLWVGTKGGGLNCLDLNQTNDITAPSAGQSADVGQHSPVVFKHYLHNASDADSLSHNTVLSIFEDSTGIIWIGTWGGGLNRFDAQAEHFEHFIHQPSDPQSLSDDTVLTIYEDTKGSLWIGTTGGLNKFDTKTKKFSHYREKDGLANDAVYGILEDAQAHLWLSTNKGLSRFNPVTESFDNYDVNDGLQSNEFTPGARFKGADGELFFGGKNGFNRFFPENIKDDTGSPEVVLTDFLLANQSVVVNPNPQGDRAKFSLPKDINALQHLTLTYQQNLITFEFAALHFTNPLKNNYAYQLIGQDSYWVQTDAKNRRATYTNLAPGDYTLRIKASNKDGYWNEQGKSLKITVEPPPWRTWWAYSFYSLLVGGMVVAFVRFERQKSIDEQRVLAERMSSLGTLTAGVAHEINNPTNFVNVSTHNLKVDLDSFQQFLIELAGPDASDDILDSFRQRFTPIYQHLATIKEGTQRIKIIVRDLKVFTGLDQADEKTVAITDLLQLTVNLVQTQYSKTIEFITDFTASPKL
ncbi:MAG: hypothetical protein MJK04_16950, partial [Psychrosphaera sp.]|nr:hypothetical protein [Psychrosphaera sp.]